MQNMQPRSDLRRMTLAVLPTPAKALATCLIATFALGMGVALGQIVVHDIIPTFFSGDASGRHEAMSIAPDTGIKIQPESRPASDRGDLFADLKVKAVQPESAPIYQNEQVVWTLKWTHIHLFGMNMIFIFMGAITLLLDLSSKARTWLIVLPFAGVVIDIIAVWLKGFVSPVFFWLHLPGGALFSLIFAYISVRAHWEMWGRSSRLRV